MIRILIADPDPTTRKALNLCLGEISDGETLIHKLAGGSPDEQIATLTPLLRTDTCTESSDNEAGGEAEKSEG